MQFKNHEIVGDIIQLAEQYSNEGADELVFYDITASPQNRTVDKSWVNLVAEKINIPFCVAGGIRSINNAEEVLNYGADKISINTPAIQDPKLINKLAERFGTQCIVIGIDSYEDSGEYKVFSNTGDPSKTKETGKIVNDWLREIQERGAGEVVLIVRASPELSINENEIMDTRWLTHEEINQMLEGENEWKNSIIAPWFRMIWKHFIDPHYPDMEALVNSNTSKIINCGRLSISSKSEGLELKSALGKHKIVVEKEIMKSMDKIRQKRLHGAMTHLFAGGGKRFRAILPRLVGEATGSAHEGHYTLGSSIEIIHNFTLVHDDIMDQDPIRRGLNAVHVEYDDATAINAGDAMLAVGFEILADSDEISPENLKFLVQSIGEMVRRVAEGQQEDFDFEQRDYVSEEEYIAMIAGKTSAMFETCAETGAKLAGADTETVENMAEWGLKLGLCFQLMDDLIDITGDTETLGKPAGSDVVQGKKTLIAIHALDSGNDLPVFSKVYGKGECTDEDLAKAVEELRNNGSIDYAMDRAMRYHSEAHSILDGLKSSRALEVLRQLTDMQLTRIN